MKIRKGRWQLIAAGVACALACPPVAAQSPAAKASESHWSFHAPTARAVPRFSDPADKHWLRTPVDAFVLAKLKENGLRPAPPADRPTLVRRLCFDLTGLPPTPEEVAAFVRDQAPDAYERLVERLLASPRYGERWGQHWLDVVRYAETEGFEYDRHRIGAWRYRDYVVAALNADKPYDRFIFEQIAGDEMDDPADPQCRIAAGFHRLGPVRRNAGNQAVAFSRTRYSPIRRTLSAAVYLGLTIGCARCHDHRFDPISQADYYRLQAFLAAATDEDIPLAAADDLARWKAAFEEANQEIQALKDRLETALGEEKDQIEAQIKMAEVRLPPPLPSINTVRNDLARRTPIHLLDRGDPARPLQAVGMRPPEALLPRGTPELPPETARPRSELARWLDAPGPSADGAGDGEPRLAVALRPGDRSDGQRLRPERRPAEPSRAA